MSVRKDTSKRVTVSAVRDAYVLGDFQCCIVLCDEYRARDGRDLEATAGPFPGRTAGTRSDSASDYRPASDRAVI